MERRDPRNWRLKQAFVEGMGRELGQRFRAGEKEMHVSKGMEMRGAGWGGSQ